MDTPFLTGNSLSQNHVKIIVFCKNRLVEILERECTDKIMTALLDCRYTYLYLNNVFFCGVGIINSLVHQFTDSFIKLHMENPKRGHLDLPGIYTTHYHDIPKASG